MNYKWFKQLFKYLFYDGCRYDKVIHCGLGRHSDLKSRPPLWKCLRLSPEYIPQLHNSYSIMSMGHNVTIFFSLTQWIARSQESFICQYVDTPPLCTAWPLWVTDKGHFTVCRGSHLYVHQLDLSGSQGQSILYLRIQICPPELDLCGSPASTWSSLFGPVCPWTQIFRFFPG